MDAASGLYSMCNIVEENQVSGPDELLARDIADVEFGCSGAEKSGEPVFMVRTKAARSILAANAALAARCEKVLSTEHLDQGTWSGMKSA
jgi:hypothetical protein